MSPAAILKAGTDEIEATVDVLALAFSADPAMRYLWPDAHAFLASFPRLARAFGGRAFEHGAAYRAENGEGAALWLPPGVEPDQEALGEIIESTVAPAARDEAYGTLEQMAAYHPTTTHWYLPMIGVDPARQGQGVGSALLKHVLREVDAAGLPAYLESSNAKNVPLYERHGFEVMGQIQAGGFPTLWPMLRAAR
ncbi:MAG TPA: GNAT family N-acetyltransferase [Caulobacteraceae bacterium]|jgi:GNAT superfamily N-acetyltransferase|nr:GNAT family N-acetyltransferase [Caulobacteraceae bacterium]